jgi:hypothetical protein
LIRWDVMDVFYPRHGSRNRASSGGSRE